jgi:two-component system phosphate regulon response regulator PhoB
MHKPLFNPLEGPDFRASTRKIHPFSTEFSTASVDERVSPAPDGLMGLIGSPAMAQGRILLVEDEPDIAEVLRYNLEKEGFDVDLEERGDAALEKLRREPPDLLLLDLMLPGLDGLEVARILQRDARTRSLPLIMLTAKGEEVDRIVGLELGADDYITKPFSPREVVLRAKAVLRRSQGAARPEGEMLSVGKLRLDVEGHRLEVDGEEISLTATEFRLLKLLMERAERVQTRGQLLSDVWGYAEDIDSRTVDTHVRRLRRKLGAAAEQIETVIGVGYRLRA